MDIVKKLIEVYNHYGFENQKTKTIEELEELKEALELNLSREAVLGEISDALNMIIQMALGYTFTSEEIKKRMEFKIDRQLERIEKEKREKDNHSDEVGENNDRG